MSTRAAQKIAYKDMNASQKLVFILKLIVCIATFGIVFPNLMSD